MLAETMVSLLELASDAGTNCPVNASLLNIGTKDILAKRTPWSQSLDFISIQIVVPILSSSMIMTTMERLLTVHTNLAGQTFAAEDNG